MTKKTSIKKQLIASIVAIALCFTSLIGTTFAWFTDSVTSSGNVIQTGKLDVEMTWAKGTEEPETAFWTDASQGAIFKNDKWEPGYAEARHIKIANAGTLALKYKVNIIANGEVSDLADVIDVYYVDPAVAVEERADLDDSFKIGTLTEVLANMGNTATGKLLKGESDTITLVLKMREGAGNEYQEKSIGSSFSIQLLATQATAENDSWDDQYDKFADYDGEISTADSFKAALAKGGTYKMVADIDVDESMTIPAGKTVNLDLNGKTLTGTKGRDADNNRIHVIVNNGILTIKDGTVKSAGNDGGSAIYNNAGATLTIEDVTLYGAPQSDPVYEAGVSKPFPSYAVNNYGNAVVNGATVKSYHGAIATGGNGVTVINDADIDVGLGQSTGITSYLIYSYENAQVTVNGGKFAFTKKEVYVNGGNTFCELGTNPIFINGGNYTKTSFSTGAGREYVIKGGTFDKDPSTYVADGYDVLPNADGTYTVVKGVVVSTYDQLVEAVKNGGNIYFANDITVDEWVMFSETKTIGNGQIITVEMDGLTIDGNGHTLTVNSIESATNGDLLFDDASNLNISNLTIKYADGLAGGINMESGVISNVTFIGGGNMIYPGTGEITVENCTFIENGAAFYNEHETDKLIVTGCTFNLANDRNIILIRGDVKFTNNTVNSGRTVNIVSGSPTVTGNNFNNVRLKVYSAATATVSNNTINNLVFEDNATTYSSTFADDNTLSAEAQAALAAMTKN